MGENMGRKTKCTKATTNKIAEGIRLGMTFELAAQYGGVHRTTLFGWLKKAEDPNAEKCFIDFFDTLKAAEASNAANALHCIMDAATDGTWQAAAWMLERRHRYIRPNVVTLETKPPAEMEVIDPTAEDGRAIVIEHVSQLPEDLILAALNLKNASNAK